ncbi:MAG: PH domain-containing protein, partial [archaeon]|nr:PH domain-containing protein [archaeon]
LKRYYATAGDKTPKGRLKIVKGMTIDVNDVPKVKPNCFILQSKKPFLLSAETHDSRQSWIRALNNAIYGNPQDVSAPLEDPKPAASPAASPATSPSASGTTLIPPPTLSSPSLEFISLQPVCSLSKNSLSFCSFFNSFFLLPGSLSTSSSLQALHPIHLQAPFLCRRRFSCQTGLPSSSFRRSFRRSFCRLPIPCEPFAPLCRHVCGALDLSQGSEGPTSFPLRHVQPGAVSRQRQFSRCGDHFFNRKSCSSPC